MVLVPKEDTRWARGGAAVLGQTLQGQEGREVSSTWEAKATVTQGPAESTAWVPKK